MASRVLKYLAAFLVAALAAVYQLYIKQYLALTGIYPARRIQSIGNQRCEPVHGIEACEKIVLHQPTGLIYMSCSFPSKRRQWTPSLDRLNPDGFGSDYIAQYNPQTKQAIRMKFADLEPNRLSSHGFDIVTSNTNSSELWVYIINHRVHEKGDPKEVGADSAVHVFKGTSILNRKGSSRLTWIKTYESPLMHTPNDVVGSADGKSFYWTNDHGSAVSKWRKWEFPLQLAHSSVGYCHETEGCKLAATGLKAANGIAAARNGTYYVASMLGSVQVFEAQKDHTLVRGDTITVDRPLDNIAVGADGSVYAAGYPRVSDALRYIDNPKIKAASSGLKISKNDGKESFFGEKYKVETIFEDNGGKMPAASSVVVDTKRKLMFMHGLASPAVMICKL